MSHQSGPERGRAGLPAWERSGEKGMNFTLLSNRQMKNKRLGKPGRKGGCVGARQRNLKRGPTRAQRPPKINQPKAMTVADLSWIWEERKAKLGGGYCVN